MEKETTLLDLKNGEKALVIKLSSGIIFQKKLEVMGIYPMATIKKIQSSDKGPVIIEVLSSKLALGRGMADKIIVQKI